MGGLCGGRALASVVGGPKGRGSNKRWKSSDIAGALGPCAIEPVFEGSFSGFPSSRARSLSPRTIARSASSILGSEDGSGRVGASCVLPTPMLPHRKPPTKSTPANALPMMSLGTHAEHVRHVCF